MSLNYEHAAMSALHLNALVPINGAYPLELTTDESIRVAHVFATLAVVERLDSILGRLEDGVLSVRDVDRV